MESARRGGRAEICTVSLTVFVDYLQLSFILPLLPKIVEGFVGSPSQSAFRIGLVNGAASLATAVSAPFLGHLADRFGRRPVFLVSLTGSVLSTLLTAFAPNYWVFFAARLVVGLCGGTAVVGSAYIIDITSRDERPKHMAHLQAAINAGTVFGPALGSAIDSFAGLTTTCIVAASISAINFVCVYLFLRESRKTRSRVVEPALHDPAALEADRAVENEESVSESVPAKPSKFAVLMLPRACWLVFFSNMLYRMSSTSPQSVGVLYLQENYFAGDVNAATVFYSALSTGSGCIGVLNCLVFYPWVVKRLGTRALLYFGGIVTILGFACMGLPADRYSWFVFFQISSSGGDFWGTSLRTLLTYVVDGDEVGKAFGVLTLFGQIARVVGPLLFTSVYSLLAAARFCIWEVSAAIAFVAVLASVFVGRRSSRELQDKCQETDCGLSVVSDGRLDVSILSTHSG